MRTESTFQNDLMGLVGLVGPHRVKMVFSGLFSIVSQGCGIVPFILAYHIIIEIAGNEPGDIDKKLIWHLVYAGIAAVILKYVFLGLSSLLSHVAAYDILYDLRVRISEKLATLPLGYFNKRNTGQIKKVMLEDVEQMEIFIGHNLPDFFGALVYIVMTTVILAMYDWRLTLATISVLPIGVCVQAMRMARNRPLREAVYTANETMNATMIQYVQGMPIIKAFNHTVDSFQKYAASVRGCKDREDRLTKAWHVPWSIFIVCLSANLLVLLPVGTMMYLSNHVTLSIFILFLFMGLGFNTPLMQLLYFGSFMDKNMEGWARIDAILRADPLPEPVDAKFVNCDGVGARGVDFAYDTVRVLKGVDFEAPPGKFLALVGPSGAGKTTLARLIPRFWDVNAGMITIGDTDIRDIKLEDLMNEETFVFQSSFLFNDTIEQNLKIGKPDATQAEIESAARSARCHDFIMGLPGGYQSVVGERGLMISGGERQRLSIARALLKNAPILVLDEATAFVDPENETIIQDAINGLVRDKTLIVIAHRLSTITDADEIMVIDQGKVIARGTHEELLEACNLYRKMWASHIHSLGWRLHSSKENLDDRFN